MQTTLLEEQSNNFKEDPLHFIFSPGKISLLFFTFHKSQIRMRKVTIWVINIATIIKVKISN